MWDFVHCLAKERVRHSKDKSVLTLSRFGVVGAGGVGGGGEGRRQCFEIRIVNGEVGPSLKIE